MLNAKKGFLIILCCLFILTNIFAQENNTGLVPSFEGSVGMNIGAFNLSNSTEIEEIQGISTKNEEPNLDLNIKGSFSSPSAYQIQKENEITDYSGIGYEAGIGLNLADLYGFKSNSSSDTMESDSSGYSRIQRMINWYEANKARYGLPENPFGTNKSWPKTSYGEKVGRYQFIIGTRVEKAEDVSWTSSKWNDAKALYNDINAAITNAIDALNSDILATDDVSQYTYATLTDANKKLAIKKQEAKASYKKARDGSSSSATYEGLQLSYAYFTITNIFNAMDVRFDFAGKKLASGKALVTDLASQSTEGSSVTFSLAKGLIPNFGVSLAAGVAGGTKQTAEDYDTIALDYNPGYPSELAIQLKADWSMYFPSLCAEVYTKLDYIMPDLMMKPLNFGADLIAGWDSRGMLSVQNELEASIVNWADRYVTDSTYGMAFSVAETAKVSYCGIGAELFANWKSAGYSARNVNNIEDVFYGTSITDDFGNADLAMAARWNAGLCFDPSYFLGMYVGEISGGYNCLHYGNSFAIFANGFYANLKFDMYDMTNIPLAFDFGTTWYKANNETSSTDAILLTQYVDLKSVERKFVNDLSISASMSFEPTEDISLKLAFKSIPTGLKRDVTKKTEIAFSATISF